MPVLSQPGAPPLRAVVWVIPVPNRCAILWHRHSLASTGVILLIYRFGGNLMGLLQLMPILWPFQVRELPSDAVRTPPGAQAVSQGPGSSLDRAECSRFAVFYRKPPPRQAPESRAQNRRGGAGLTKCPCASCRKIPCPSAAAQRAVGPQPTRETSAPPRLSRLQPATAVPIRVGRKRIWAGP